MAQTTVQIPTTNSSAPLNYARPPQVVERRARYPGPVVHQPDQANNSAVHNLAEVTQGLKELQEKINGALKRSSSAVRLGSTPNTSMLLASPAPGSVLNTETSEISQKTVESIYPTRTNILSSPTPSYVPSNVSSSALLRENLDSFHLQSPPTSSSNKFYLGSLNPNYGRKEELLTSIKNYQVKTIHTLNALTMSSSRTTQQLPQTPSFDLQHKRPAQSLGASTIMFGNPAPIQGFQPGYDSAKLDSVISKIMGSQSFNGVRQDSFVSSSNFTNLTTVQDSLLTTKLDESNAPKRRAAVRKAQPAAKREQKPVATKKQPKESHCDDFGADGDSMILEFIREKDQLNNFVEDDFTGRTAKRVREVEEDKPQPKRVSKRQEILSSKRQVKGSTQEPKKLRKDSSATNQSSGAAQTNKRRN